MRPAALALIAASGCSLMFGDDRVARDDEAASSSSSGISSSSATGSSAEASSSTGSVSAGAEGGGGDGGMGEGGATSGGGDGGAGGIGPTGHWPDSPTAFCTDGEVEIACPGPPTQDGNVTAPLTGYDVTALTAIDPMTGLVWHRDATTAEDFEAATATCEAMADGGRDDWRLPSVRELTSLWDAGRGGLTIDEDVFINLGLDYWSGSEQADSPNRTMIVSFDPSVVYQQQDAPDANRLARCVAGAPSVPDMVGGDDGTATDRSTGLTWEFNPPEQSIGWLGALERCEELELGQPERGDWRLPTIKELATLVDVSTASVPQVDAFMIQWTSDYRWTSTPDPSKPDSAFLFSFTTGHAFAGDTSTTANRFATCVRGGQEP